MKKKLLLPAVLMTVLFAVLVWLGFWQLERSEHKQSSLELLNQAQQQKPLMIKTADQITTKYLHRPIILEGHYLSDAQLIYDNQIKNQEAGYFVITPFVIKDSSRIILVNRGFVAWEGGHRKIANITVNSTNTKLLANIKKPIKRLVLNQQNIDDKSPFPRLIQAIDINQLNKVYGGLLLPVILELHPSQTNGYVRQWQAYYGISPERHFAYALQWWTMAGVLALIGFILMVRLRKETLN